MPRRSAARRRAIACRGTDFRCGTRAAAVRPDARRHTYAAISGCARNCFSLRLFAGNDAALPRGMAALW